MGGVTVMELIRSATTTPDEQGEQVRRPEVGAALGGALTALAGLTLVLVLVLLGALAVPHATAGVGESIGAGALTWLVLGGARLGLADGHLAFTPLLALAGLVALARAGARRTPLDDTPRVLGSWVGGYALVGVVAALLGLLTPVAPRALSLLLPLVVVPSLGLLWDRGLLPALAERWERAPRAVRRGLLPGAKGAGLALAAGTALLVLAVAIQIERVGHVQGSLGPGFFGGLLLVLLQLGAVPNLGIWALSLAAGPGFSTTDGAMTTWSGAEAGLLPMVPVLAAQPQPGPLPWVTHLLVLVPVLVGAWIGRSVLARVPRLAPTTAKLAAAAAGVATAAVIITVLDIVAGGSLGGQRLTDLGAPALTLGAVLAAEMGLGALAVLARDWWVLRR